MPESPKQTKAKREATSIKIDPALWKEAKIEAINRDLELSELVELSLKKELRTQKKGSQTGNA
jgi:post-segregation antitoxin (ccd killing protein)